MTRPLSKIAAFRILSRSIKGMLDQVREICMKITRETNLSHRCSKIQRAQPLPQQILKIINHILKLPHALSY